LKGTKRAGTKVVLRELESPEEFHETVDVGRSAWRFSDRLLSPASDLIAGTHAGGLTAGAFEKGRMLGFVFGLPRTNQGAPCQHSHLLAVRREAQGRGLGVLLKLFQRRWCLERNIQLVTWTYDPFLVKNARLNIGRLRATARAYLPNFYGDMGGIYGALPTDRFEVVWRLDDPIVERAVHGDEAPAPYDVDSLPLVRSGRIPASPRVLLSFPAGAPAVYRTNPDGMRAAKHLFGRTATTLFTKGYEATAVAECGGSPVYVFERR
jgi:predicted GNAT superfamily acetyltransferase